MSETLKERVIRVCKELEDWALTVMTDPEIYSAMAESGIDPQKNIERAKTLSDAFSAMRQDIETGILKPEPARDLLNALFAASGKGKYKYKEFRDKLNTPLI